MEKELYQSLKGQLAEYLPEIKTISLWNNQFNRSNGTGHDGRKEQAFNYPAIYIQFENSNFRQLRLGVQEYDVALTIYLGYESFITDDLAILDLKERVYWVCQRFQQGNYARLSRITEEWDYDHDDVNILKMTFRTYGKDYNRYVFATTPLDSITGVTITENVVYILSGDTSNPWSGATQENGNNLFDGDITQDNQNDCEE